MNSNLAIGAGYLSKSHVYFWGAPDTDVGTMTNHHCHYPPVLVIHHGRFLPPLDITVLVECDPGRAEQGGGAERVGGWFGGRFSG